MHEHLEGANRDASPPDLLGQLLEQLRARFAESKSSKDRLVALWAFAKVARNLGPQEALAAEFIKLSRECGLLCSRQAEQDAAHVVDWGLRGFNPFETGPVQ